MFCTVHIWYKVKLSVLESDQHACWRFFWAGHCFIYQPHSLLSVSNNKTTV